jgi:hypothetical protein
MCKNENDANLDLDPYDPTNSASYRGVTLDRALRGGNVHVGCGRGYDLPLDGFKYGGSNDRRHLQNCKKPPKEHYGFANGYGWGFNCNYICSSIPTIEDISPKDKELISGEVIRIRHTVKIIIKTILSQNLIFYPRSIDKVSKDLSRSIYLHELGHQLDTWNIFCEIKQTNEKTLYCNFFGDTANKMYAKWVNVIDRLSDALQRKYYRQYIYECERVKHIYHEIHGKIGNPWEPKPIVCLTDKEKAEDDKTLAEAEIGLANAEIVLAKVEKELAELTDNKSEEKTANTKLTNAEKKLDSAKKS